MSVIITLSLVSGTVNISDNANSERMISIVLIWADSRDSLSRETKQSNHQRASRTEGGVVGRNLGLRLECLHYLACFWVILYYILHYFYITFSTSKVLIRKLSTVWAAVFCTGTIC